MISICVYHGIDLDGWCSAAIVKEKYPDCKMIPYNYGDNLELPEGDVIFVDVSLEMDKFKKLLREGRKIVWIDHHISAIANFDSELRYDVQGNKNFQFSLNPKKAACELTWEFINPGKPMPKGVYYLGRYDCFGHKGTSEEETVLAFQYGARAIWHNWETTSEVLHLSDDKISEILKDGKIILESLKTEANQAYTNRYNIKVDGYSVGAINKERFNPINFGINYHNDGYDAFMCYHYANGHWNFSIYNDNGKVDCSEICKKRGGGGHRGAAGFRTKPNEIQKYLK